MHGRSRLEAERLTGLQTLSRSRENYRTVVWAKLNLANSSTYRDVKSSSGLNEHDAIAKWSDDFWHALIKNKVRSFVERASRLAKLTPVLARSYSLPAHTTRHGRARVSSESTSPTPPTSGWPSHTRPEKPSSWGSSVWQRFSDSISPDAFIAITVEAMPLRPESQNYSI